MADKNLTISATLKFNSNGTGDPEKPSEMSNLENNLQSDSEYSDCQTSPAKRPPDSDSTTLFYYSADSLNELSSDTPDCNSPDLGETLQPDSPTKPDTSMKSSNEGLPPLSFPPLKPPSISFAPPRSTSTPLLNKTLQPQKTLPPTHNSSSTTPTASLPSPPLTPPPPAVSHNCSEAEASSALESSMETLPATVEENGPELKTVEILDEEEDLVAMDSEDEAYEDDEEPHYHAQPLRQQRRQENPKLPETVTVLTTEHGGRVYLVGTAHFSTKSQEDVAATIRATQPDMVVVELCKSRVSLLAMDEQTILEESQALTFNKMYDIVNQSGVKQGVLYLLLLSMSGHLTRKLGMAPGGEFRRACEEAKKVPGCLVQLGDRPIHITLNRVLAYLSLWQKAKLAWYLLTSKYDISQEDVEKCKQRDLLEQLLAEMAGEFPKFSQVLVDERNLYLAYSLRLACSRIGGSDPSPQRVVVGVVGIGHVPGIVENWDNVSEEQIKIIMEIPETPRSTRLLRKTVRYSILALVAWGCYRMLPSNTAESCRSLASYLADAPARLLDHLRH